MELALQVKVSKVALFVGKIFVDRPSTTKTTNIFPNENYPVYSQSIKWHYSNKFRLRPIRAIAF